MKVTNTKKFMKNNKLKKEIGVSQKDETVMIEYPNKKLTSSDFTLLRCIEILSNGVCEDVSQHLDKHVRYKPKISKDSIEQLLGVPEVLERIWTGKITEEDLDRPFERFESRLQDCHTLENLTSGLSSNDEDKDNGNSPRFPQFELKDSESYDLLKSSLKVYNFIHSCPVEGVFDFSDEENDQQKDTGYEDWENNIRTLLGGHFTYLSGVTMDSTLSDKWKEYLKSTLSKTLDLLDEFFKGDGRIEKDGEFVITGPWDETSCYEFIQTELKDVVKSPLDMFMECFEMDEFDESITPEPLCEQDHEECQTWNNLTNELENYCFKRNREVSRFKKFNYI